MELRKIIEIDAPVHIVAFSALTDPKELTQ